MPQVYRFILLYTKYTATYCNFDIENTARCTFLMVVVMLWSLCDETALYNIYCYHFYRYNLFTGCPQAKTCTLLLRGGAEQFIEETERSLHDAIMIVRRAMKNDSVVAGV